MYDSIRRPAAWIASLLLVGGALCAGGCGDDPVEDLRVRVTTSTETLRADGVNTAEIRVTASRGGENLPVGTAVDLRVFPTGTVGDEGGREARERINNIGRAVFQVSCTSDEPFEVEATVDGVTQLGDFVIACEGVEAEPLTLSLRIEPRFLAVEEGRAEVTASVVTESGRNGPAGVSLRMSTTGPITFSGGGTTVVRPTAAEGRVSVSIASRGRTGDGRVCVAFNDPSISDESVCLRVFITDSPPDGPSCVGTLSESRLPATGTATTNAVFNVFTETGDPIAEATLEVTTERGELREAPDGAGSGQFITRTTDADGIAEVFIRAPSSAGPAELSATATTTIGGTEIEIPCVLLEPLTFFGRPECTVGAVDPEILGVRASGRNESGRVRICFADADEVPVPPGYPVNLTWVTRIGGAEISPTTANTNDEGCVSVLVRSGTQAGEIEFRATYPFGDSETVCTSAPIPVLGARPTNQGWNLTCTPENLPARVEFPDDDLDDSIRARQVEAECTTTLRDRFNNVVNFPGTQVFFHVEQGTILSPVTVDEEGRVTTIYRPIGTNPRDVQPLASGESRARVAGSDTRFRNPRDMMVTIVAYTEGEEGFDDLNGNGRHDEGEIFYDQGEPLFDYNDNNAYDPEPPLNEGFIDLNENGTYDGPNGTWDSETVIWTDTRIVLSGIPRFGPLDAFGLDPDSPDTNQPAFSYLRRLDGSFVPPQSTLNLAIGTHEFELLLRDAWFVPIAPGATARFTLADCGNNVSFAGNTGGTINVGRTGFRQSRTLVPTNADGQEATGADRVVSYRYRNVVSMTPRSELARPVSLRVPESAGSFDCRLNVAVTVVAGNVSRTVDTHYRLVRAAN